MCNQGCSSIITSEKIIKFKSMDKDKRKELRDGDKVMTYDIKPGRYRHYKGNEYEVLYTATHSETLEEMVVYRALYGEHGVWVRPAYMWDEIVEKDGRKIKRFEYIG